MSNEERSEIKVASYIWKQKMLITGYYEFEISIKTYFKNQYTERKIYRRYSDIEWLHEGLLKYNPGCRVIPLPEKSVWCNLNVNNNQLLEKRRMLIEEYLNYINKHKYLSENSFFKSFISEDFDKSKMESKKHTFMDKISSLREYLPNVLTKSNKMCGLSTIEDNSKLEKERENLVRLLKAVDNLNINMNTYVKLNDEKTESIKNILFSARSLNYNSLDYNNLPDNDEENNSKQDKLISKNLDLINNYYEKSKIFYNLIVSNLHDQIQNYELELKGLIEIFDRKESEENFLHELNKSDINEDNRIHMSNQKILIENLNIQLMDEITNFKLNRENDILKIINRFFKDKTDLNNEISQIFDMNK